MRPAWLEINLSAIGGNLRAVKDLVGPSTQVIAVVKANAYGHGAASVARELVGAGADMLAVALPQEGVELREAGLSAPILVLGAAEEEEAEDFCRHDLTAALSDLGFARAVSRAAQRRGATAQAHVKVDSGMGRQGVRAQEVAALAAEIAALPSLTITGAFSHFAACPRDAEFTREQGSVFSEAVGALEAGLGYAVRLKHLANSAAVAACPEMWLDAVRPGALLYGIIRPAGLPEGVAAALRPALALKCRLVGIKRLLRGESVGYGRAHVAEADSRTGLLPVGYADGYPRALSGPAPGPRAEVLLHGRRCPVLGRISMDCTVVDVGGVPQAQVGDEVVLIGSQGTETVAALDLAGWAQTVPHEIVSRLGPRLPRLYLPA